jgi:histidine triad (HIT) family protein
MDDCVFCKIVKKELPAKFVYQDDDIVAFPSIAPQTPVHLLIVPKKHIKNVNDLKDSDADLAGRMILVGKKLAKEKEIDQTGYRLVFNVGPHSGQTIDHLHLHLLGGKMLDVQG